MPSALNGRQAAIDARYARAHETFKRMNDEMFEEFARCRRSGDRAAEAENAFRMRRLADKMSAITRRAKRMIDAAA